MHIGQDQQFLNDIEYYVCFLNECNIRRGWLL